jgi:hypothetical protein
VGKEVQIDSGDDCVVFTKDSDPAVGQRAESRQQRGERREQRAESREERGESREQRAESREQTPALPLFGLTSAYPIRAGGRQEDSGAVW